MSNSFIIVSDIVETNGKTIKENNLAVQHEIPLGSLVEITDKSEYEEPSESTFGLRLFVVNHSRDCDGKPLYDLSFDKTAFVEWKKLDTQVKNKSFENAMDEQLTKFILWQTGGKILRHYSVGSLQVIS